MATTNPPVTDHLEQDPFAPQPNSLSARKRPVVNFLNDRDHFLNQKFDIFLCFLFPLSDHPAFSRMIVRKPFLQRQKRSAFDCAHQAYGQDAYCYKSITNLKSLGTFLCTKKVKSKRVVRAKLFTGLRSTSCKSCNKLYMDRFGRSYNI